MQCASRDRTTSEGSTVTASPDSNTTGFGPPRTDGSGCRRHLKTGSSFGLPLTPDAAWHIAASAGPSRADWGQGIWGPNLGNKWIFGGAHWGTSAWNVPASARKRR